MIMYHKKVLCKIHHVYNIWIRDIAMTNKWNIELTESLSQLCEYVFYDDFMCFSGGFIHVSCLSSPAVEIV